MLFWYGEGVGWFAIDHEEAMKGAGGIGGVMDSVNETKENGPDCSDPLAATASCGEVEPRLVSGQLDSVLQTIPDTKSGVCNTEALMGRSRGRPHGRSAMSKPDRLLPAEPSAGHQDNYILKHDESEGNATYNRYTTTGKIPSKHLSYIRAPIHADVN